MLAYPAAIIKLHFSDCIPGIWGFLTFYFFLRVREVRGQLFCFLLTLVAVNGGFL